jgi:thiosulfate/3-mercaptopyruvate sulfurtransferase
MPFTTLIDVESLAALAGPAVLLDCRFDLSLPDAGRRAYAAGHIPGARYADLNLDLSSPVTSASGRHPLPRPDVLADFFAAAGIGDETQVIAYDDANGSFAARAWWLLGWLGKAPVAVLDGGFKAWVAAGGAVEVGEPAPAAGGAKPPFTVRLRPDTVLRIRGGCWWMRGRRNGSRERSNPWTGLPGTYRELSIIRSPPT